ncbi:MAG: hypothetical protein ACXW2A_13710 [Burkholderiales bacterium]
MRGRYFVAEEDDAPPGPLEAAAPLLLDEAPALPPGELEDEAPSPELLVPPIPPGLELLLELEPGALGAVLEDDEEPPGTMIVSFSFVVDDEAAGALPPGTTVVVSLRSQADSANAPTTNNR